MIKQNQECCPKFNSTKWDKKIFNWNNKKFIKESIPTLFHMPWPPMIDKKIAKMYKMAEKSKKIISDKTDMLILFTDPHPFKSELYLAVTGEVQDANNTEISGTFIGQVFDGPYSYIPKFMKQMDEYLNKEKKKAKKYYIHYAYCPGCAKKFKQNYMIIFAQV